jgi:hypothetical protein
MTLFSLLDIYSARVTHSAQRIEKASSHKSGSIEYLQCSDDHMTRADHILFKYILM